MRTDGTMTGSAPQATNPTLANNAGRKILVAVDGSVHSFNALRYLSHLFTDLADIQVHLLFVVPSGGPVLGHEWLDEGDRLLSLRPEARAKVRVGKRFMEEAVLQLGRRGIAPDQVSCSVTLSRMGVAQDIITEARAGYYDALLIGRRGLSKIEELVMGSLSSTIVEQCSDLPIWIVDGKVDSRRFLMPVDETFNSLKAADHLGYILRGNPHVEIVLFHLASYLWNFREADMEELSKQWGEEWCREHLAAPDSLARAPERMLIERGIAPERIRRLEVMGDLGASRKIVEQSVIDQCGTIVIGRRSRHRKRGLFSGVSDQVLALAEHVAVWVV